MQRIINDHFQDEIKLTKEITSKEKAIASKKVELKKHQISLLNFPSKSDNNEKINSLSKDIKNNYKIIEKKKLLQEKYIKKRFEIRKIIKLQNNEYSNNILNDCLEYFLILLKNINLESTKSVDSADLKIKDLQIHALTSQINAKDVVIEKSNLNKDLSNNKSYLAIDSQVLSSNIKDSVADAKIDNFDYNLINGLKEEKSVDKSQIIKSQQIENIKVFKENKNNIKDFINKSPFVKQKKNINYIKNFKKSIKDVFDIEAFKKNVNNQNNQNDIKLVKSETYSN